MNEKEITTLICELSLADLRKLANGVPVLLDVPPAEEGEPPVREIEIRQDCDEEMERAIDEILKYNLTGKYKKVTINDIWERVANKTSTIVGDPYILERRLSYEPTKKEG